MQVSIELNAPFLKELVAEAVTETLSRQYEVAEGGKLERKGGHSNESLELQLIQSHAAYSLLDGHMEVVEVIEASVGLPRLGLVERLVDLGDIDDIDGVSGLEIVASA